MSAGSIFYVYEHWRPDKDVCFYVGKGHGDRAWRFARRNRFYCNIVTKLARLGMCPEVRLVRSRLIECEALAVEIERITFWRSTGTILSNLTAGGEGVVGLKHSDSTKEVIRQKRLRQTIILSEETKKKIGAANSVALRGRKNPEHSARLKGRKHSAEHRAKIGEGMKGRIVSDETRAKMAAAQTGRMASAQAIENMRAAHLGKKPSDETRAKMRQAQLLRWAKIKAEA